VHEKELNKATKWMVFNLGLEMVNSQIYKDVILFIISIQTKSYHHVKQFNVTIYGSCEHYEN
jgi:hypothetical protein